MIPRFKVFLFAMSALFFCHSAHAIPVLDQANDPFSAGLNGAGDTRTWQQGVTAGLSGLLSTIEISVGEVGTLDFFVNVGAPWQSDSNDFQNASLAVTPGWNSIDISSANILVNPGDQFVIGIHGVESTSALPIGASVDNRYPEGLLFLNGSDDPSVVHGLDMAFRTYVEVPEPTTLALMGLGLAGIGYRRHRSKTAA